MSVSLESRERLADLVKKVRGQSSQRQFSKLIGVTQTAVYQWEKGMSWPEANSLQTIAHLSGYTFESLVEYLEGRKSTAPVKKNEILRQIDRMNPIDLREVITYSVERLASMAS